MGKRIFIAPLHECTKQKCVNGIFTGALEKNTHYLSIFTWLVQYGIHFYIVG